MAGELRDGYNDGFLPTNITTNTTTTVKTGPGALFGISVNTVGTTSTAAIYDNTAGSGTLIGTIDTLTRGTVIFNAKFSIGLTVVTAGAAAANITVLVR